MVLTSKSFVFQLFSSWKNFCFFKFKIIALAMCLLVTSWMSYKRSYFGKLCWNFMIIFVLTGMDAQVSYAFHSERKLHPEKFKNQLNNQVVMFFMLFKCRKHVSNHWILLYFFIAIFQWHEHRIISTYTVCT